MNHNTITINGIKILGANIGGGADCKKCPIGSIRNNLSDNNCIVCDKGKTSNKDSIVYFSNII